MSATVQIDWSARWKVSWWSSWLRWRSRVDLEEKYRLGPVCEWLQPGIGHGRRSIIVSVASCGGGRMCGGLGRVKAPLRDSCENCREGHFRSDVVGGIVDKFVEFVGACCGTDGECEGPGRVS